LPTHDFPTPDSPTDDSLLVAALTCIGIAIALFLPTLRPVEAGSGDQALVQSDTPVTAAEYCVNHGGEVDSREPYYNTNDVEQNWLQLSGSRQFCKFTLAKDGSRIYVLLSTLFTEQPSLAALAYYAQVPLESCNGNPASCYCSQLGGTDLFGGVNLNGGGWVKKSDPVDTVLEACIFPDMSSIDSWGLAYHSAGIIRGKDLSKVLRYKNPYATK
jgi:putative hemolysin